MILQNTTSFFLDIVNESFKMILDFETWLLNYMK